MNAADGDRPFTSADYDRELVASMSGDRRTIPVGTVSGDTVEITADLAANLVVLRVADRYLAMHAATALVASHHLDWLLEQAVAIFDGDPRPGGQIDLPGDPDTFVAVGVCLDCPTLVVGTGGAVAVLDHEQAQELGWALLCSGAVVMAGEAGMLCYHAPGGR